MLPLHKAKCTYRTMHSINNLFWFPHITSIAKINTIGYHTSTYSGLMCLLHLRSRFQFFFFIFLLHIITQRNESKPSMQNEAKRKAVNIKNIYIHIVCTSVNKSDMTLTIYMWNSVREKDDRLTLNNILQAISVIQTILRKQAE